MKRAFRRLARELHPDVNAHDPEAEEKFKAAAKTYEVLSDPSSARSTTASATTACAGRLPARRRRIQLGRGIFSAVFGGAFGFEVRRGPMRGQDLMHAVEISAVQAMLGASGQDPQPRG